LEGYRLIVYRSVARHHLGDAALRDILLSSRRNNGIEGVSGMLWRDGERFVQALEGAPESVAHLLRRIAVDPRHEALEILIDRMEDQRHFGDWTMADMSDALTGDDRLRQALGHCPPDVAEAFGRKPDR
jgi:hypothetical protein